MAPHAMLRIVYTSPVNAFMSHQRYRSVRSDTDRRRQGMENKREASTAIKVRHEDMRVAITA